MITGTVFLVHDARDHNSSLYRHVSKFARRSRVSPLFAASPLIIFLVAMNSSFYGLATRTGHGSLASSLRLYDVARQTGIGNAAVWRFESS